MEPTISPVPNGYRIEFAVDREEPPYITFDCEYIEMMAWGIVTTLTVRTNISTSRRLPDGVVLLDRINLLRSRDLKEIAIRIDALIPPPKSGTPNDWQRHLEHVAVLINAEQQRPVPLVNLVDKPIAPRTRFVIPGLLAKGKANIIYGPGGSGKSVLSLRIGASVLTGRDFLGMDVLHRGHVMYLDWEDDEETITERLAQVCDGMRMARIPMAYKGLHGKGPYERHHADIRYALTQADYTLVIFDSTAMAMHGSSAGDGADGAIKFFNLINQLPVTSLLLDHVASEDLKSGAGTPKPYGSVFKANSARNMWEVQPWKRDRLTGMTLRHRKTNVGPRMDDVDISVDWNQYNVRFERLTQATVQDEAPG